MSVSQPLPPAIRTLSAALMLVFALSACDSGPDANDVTESRFEATLSGTVNKTIRGTANSARSSAMGSAFSGLFAPLPVAPPDSGLFTPPDSLRGDSLFVPPPDSLPELPSGTALVLSTADAPGQGEGLSFFFAGDTMPATGEYRIAAPLLFPGDGSPSLPQSDVNGTYSELDGQEFTLAPIVSGTVTIETSTADVLRGRFSLQTVRALTFTFPAPGDTALFTDPVVPRPFATTINGTFVATPADAPPVPAPQR
jgi:hypothetical protein